MTMSMPLMLPQSSRRILRLREGLVAALLGR
jgi:hypothetical protein